VLILLPPSEGKTTAAEGNPLSLDSLSAPSLNPTRLRAVNALVKLSAGSPTRARKVLGLTPRQDNEVCRNQQLLTAPAVAAADVYTGVVYDSMDYRSLSATHRRRLDRWVLISSALWGCVRLNDRIPAYRLSADVTLPVVGPLRRLWRRPLAEVMPTLAGNRGPVLDLRSSGYANMWAPSEALAERVLVGRVLQVMPNGSRRAVSHHNKATKGRLVRDLAVCGDTPGSVADLVKLVQSLGYVTDLTLRASGKPHRLDIVVAEL